MALCVIRSAKANYGIPTLMLIEQNNLKMTIRHMSETSPESEERLPPRQQRKEETHRSLIRSAQALFAEQGYRQTTLEQIAEHAGLHVQTLYRHFANKIELATAGEQEKFERFRDAIQKRESQWTFAFWRAWVLESARRVTLDDGGAYYRESLVERFGQEPQSSPLGVQMEDLLTQSLDLDYPFVADDPQPNLARLAAIALWGANFHTLRRYALGQDFDLPSEAVATVDAVKSAFQPLLEAANAESAD